eukprot:scaffold1803_cov92-Amphora_coffeaeformis.AAC.4
MLQQELNKNNHHANSVKEIEITPQHTTSDIHAALESCSILMIGIHGAGLVNTLLAPASATMIEILPLTSQPPAYYRNLNLLLGRAYESVTSNFSMETPVVQVNVEAIRPVVQRAVARFRNGNAAG